MFMNVCVFLLFFCLIVTPKFILWIVDKDHPTKDYTALGFDMFLTIQNLYHSHLLETMLYEM